LYGPEGSVIFDHLAVRHQVTPVMTAARAAIDQARRNEQPIIKIGNEFQPRDIMMNALRRHAAMARWDPDSAFYLPKWKSDAFCNPAPADSVNASRRCLNQVDRHPRSSFVKLRA
jgi:hypothetical protein